MRASRIFISTLLLGLVSSSAASAQDLLPYDNGIFNYHQPPRYRPSESHPLRTLAYVLHPVGWVLREGFYRPFSAFAGSSTFTKSFFGYREPYDFRKGECYEYTGTPDCRTVPPYSSIGNFFPTSSVIIEGGEPVASNWVDESGAMVGSRQVYFPDVAFEFDKSSLTDLGRGRVRQVAQLLATVPGLEVVVEGNTDFVGTDEYNEKLGMRRAETVVSELESLGVDPARMSKLSVGEGNPIFTEEEDWARAVNRRVRFQVKGSESAESGV